MTFIHTAENYADLVVKAMDAEKAEDEKTVWPSHIKLTDNPKGRFLRCIPCNQKEDILYDVDHIASERRFIRLHQHK